MKLILLFCVAVLVSTEIIFTQKHLNSKFATLSCCLFSFLHKRKVYSISMMCYFSDMTSCLVSFQWREKSFIEIFL